MSDPTSSDDASVDANSALQLKVTQVLRPVMAKLKRQGKRIEYLATAARLQPPAFRPGIVHSRRPTPPPNARESDNIKRWLERRHRALQP